MSQVTNNPPVLVIHKHLQIVRVQLFVPVVGLLALQLLGVRIQLKYRFLEHIWFYTFLETLALLVCLGIAFLQEFLLFVLV